jgi:hypothetical protein
MKVKDLIAMLSERNPEAKILVRMDGSIFGTDNTDEHNDYNDGSEDEFFILAVDDFPDGE